MNLVKRERISAAVENYKAFKDDHEKNALHKEVIRLMNRPWPFNIKTPELAIKKIEKNHHLSNKIYRTWHDDTMALELKCYLDIVEDERIALDRDQIVFVTSFENFKVRGKKI